LRRRETDCQGRLRRWHRHIALQTSKEDFDHAVDELKKAGVKVLIDKPVARPTGRGLYFFDTEGNYIQLQCPE
jgi:glyoxylase I family protein